jgi:hypothetical protein
MESEKVFRRRLAAAENMAVRSRNYRRARERALTALARLHKEDYLELLAEEKAKDEQEGKRWVDLTGSNVSTQLSVSDLSTGKVGRDTSDISQDESDNE